MKVKNKKTVLYGTAIKVADGLKPHRVGLRQVDDPYQPYVTHMENMQLEDLETFVHESFYWGHYFAERADAEKDFEERSDKF